MRSLVTGATGFIGSHVAEILKERGHTVRLLVRNETRLYPELREGYDIVKGTLAQSPDELAKLVEGVDYVFHIAGLIKGRTQREFNAVNAEGTRKLLQAVTQTGSELMRFVLVSSLAAIGPSEDSRHFIAEDSVPHPVTFYGRSKLLGEKLAMQFADKVPLTIIRPPAVYGPRDTGILEFFQFMAKGYALQFGSQEKSFSMIHGRDLARGIVESAMHDGAIGEAFFLTDPEPYSMSWTMQLLRDTLQPRKNKTLAPPVWLAKGFARFNDILQFITRKPRLPNSDKMRELLPPYWMCSGDKAKEVFDFEPEISIEDGLKETADWYIKNGWIKVK